MVAYYNVEGHGHKLLDFYAPTTTRLKHCLTYKCWSLKDQRRRSILVNLEEEVSRRGRIWEYESSYLAHTNPTPTDSIYIWASLSLFPLEFGGQVAYMEMHP